MTEALASPLAALDEGRWDDARELLERVVAESSGVESPDPRTLEALGTAYFWLDHPETVAVRERAYRAYRDLGDALGAARLATALAFDHVTFRGELAVGQGWLALAARSLSDVPMSAEHGFLAAWEADFAIAVSDVAQAEQHASTAVAIGRELGVPDIELLGQAQLGYALVMRGEIPRGMRLLDASAAAAAAGEVVDPALAGYCFCYVISACSHVLDLPRAAEWCGKLDGHCRGVGFHSMQHLCRTQYAGVLIERGEWEAAEREILEATEVLRARRPGMAEEPIARLAELRRRQGRTDEARALFAQIESHPRAVLGMAAIALDEGDPSTAAARAVRLLRQVPVEESVSRVAALTLLVRARVALGELDEARTTLAELADCSDVVGPGPLCAGTLVADAELRLAEGRPEPARTAAEDAIDMYERAGTPYGAAQARTVLARALLACGDQVGAGHAVASAARGFELLGAGAAAQAARQLVAPAGRAGPLTPREIEVLRLVAGGLSNAEVARKLVLSEHTVHRHVANALGKLGVPTRAAAVSRATVLGLL